ncbi:hypothetical protein CONPUDRAFT_68232 [Coniophora puteana RWD-64-598 SS2]|uniref:Retrotransposon gag domain-containing protein n=1 Tax=Coniophora puteana (strain RWD-64-598) TaxID=741705 RepID=R7SDC7_CONPW|nr:uncharacterized protein CONPUDRAFT_68232 [Coniophora puteana RWD-64-598 SS2]EIW73870.1 hypothetical protein CONPUDRAFT_68232 [Coniophora puteana RWD-64-598 SS2]
MRAQTQAQGQQQAPAVQTVNAETKAIAKPTAFKGERSDARHFLAYFQIWAKEQGRPLNLAGVRQDRLWIKAALSLMEGDAATWGRRYVEDIASHEAGGVNAPAFPFSESWTTFVDNYKVRWQAQDEEAEARHALDKLSQGTLGVADYAARFQDLASRTGYSDADLRVHFYARLSNAIKTQLLPVELAHGKPTDLNTLVKRACKAQDLLDELRMETGGYASRRYGNTPQAAPRPAADPYAMEVDATRTGNGKTREEFQRAMTGRCFGCGSKEHLKRDGNHQTDRCGYCSRTGHKETVCEDKYLGRERNQGQLSRGQGRQRVAASRQDSAPFSLFTEPPTATVAASIPVADQNTTQIADLERILAEQQALLDRLRPGF